MNISHITDSLQQVVTDTKKRDCIYIAAAILLGTFGFARLPESYFAFDDFAWLVLARQWLEEGLPFWYNPWRVFTPLTHLYYIVNYSLWAENAAGYYVANLLLHSLNVGLTYILARQLRFSPISAFLGAATFAVLFAHFEAISWITGVIRLLLALFMLGSLITLLLYLRCKNPWLFWCSIGMYLMTLLSKEWGIEVAGVAFLLIVWEQKREEPPSLVEVFKIWWPYLLITAIYGGFLFWYWRMDATLFPYESTAHMRFGLHIPTNLYVYLGAFLIPSPSWDNVRNQLLQRMPALLPLLQFSTLIAVIVLLLSFGAAIVKGRPRVRVLIVWLFGGLVLISVSSGGCPSRYLYIPSIPFCLLLTLAVEWLWNKASIHPQTCRYRILLVGGIITFLVINIMGNWVTTVLMVKNGETRKSLVAQIREIAAQAAGEEISIVGLPLKYQDTIGVMDHFTSTGSFEHLPVAIVNENQLSGKKNAWSFNGQRLQLLMTENTAP